MARAMVTTHPPPPAREPAAAPLGERPSDGGSASDGAARRITSERLFAGAAEVQIEHHGAVYRLKQTSLGKLILTK